MSVVLLVLIVKHDAHCLPPDKVTGSPVPPLLEDAQRPSKPTQWNGNSGFFPSTSKSAISSPQKASTKPQAQPKKRSVKAEVEPTGEGTDYNDQQDLWNSPLMREARETVTEFCKRAKQTSPEEGEQFLEQLKQLPPEQMRDWLKRYFARRQSALRNQERGALTRRLGVERSLDHIEASRRSAENVAELRRQAAASRPSYFISKPFGLIPSFGVDAATRQFGFRYDPMEAVVDPMSPRGYERAVAAGMSLPGDLPRGDARNFIRGEEGVDFGTAANPGQAAPPAVAAPPPVATPAAAPAAGP